MNNLLNHLTELIAEKVSQRINLENEGGSTVTNNSDTEFLSTDEALNVLKIKSKVTLRSYVLAGLIPKPKRIGGRKLVYKKSDLLKFLGDGK